MADQDKETLQILHETERHRRLVRALVHRSTSLDGPAQVSIATLNTTRVELVTPLHTWLHGSTCQHAPLRATTCYHASPQLMAPAARHHRPTTIDGTLARCQQIQYDVLNLASQTLCSFCPQSDVG
jgi:hypothetical protein